jgi:epoxyqueuosine reductase
MPKKLDFEAKYHASAAKPFDQKNEMFKRARREPEMKEILSRVTGELPLNGRNGATRELAALRNAAWTLESGYARGIATNNFGLYSWREATRGISVLPDAAKFDPSDPARNARIVKKAAKTFGADLVGICKLDRRWIYSSGYNTIELKEYDIAVPEECEYAIVMAFEMDYESMKHSPMIPGGVTTGFNYSRMAFTTGTMGQFVRHLGFTSIPCGNDTALNVPMAIEAGLGELGRNGILITQEFGPRVRLAKIFTNLPMACDEPIQFGVDKFCEVCKLCATHCPSRSIPDGPKTTSGHNKSNNDGPLKWYVNGETCYQFWGRNRCDCSVCIRVCPFNKPKGLLHSAARWFIEKIPALNKAMLKGDALFGYGRLKPAEKFWEDE